MRRAERLFELVQLIRGRRLSTAAWLAVRLEVSERTVYRDIVDLQSQGVPIEGEAGVGYRMRAGFDLPPLMFTNDEAKALVAAVRVAQPRLDAALASQAVQGLSKILSVLPSTVRAAAESLALYSPLSGMDGSPVGGVLESLRMAIETRHLVDVDYVDLQDRPSSRRLRPLSCLLWESVWTLDAWCELRQDFRSFRIDRIRRLDVLDLAFRDEPGKTLADLHRRRRAERAERDCGTDA